MLRFAMSGGNFLFTQGENTPGVWLSAAGGLTATAPAGRVDTFAHTSSAVTPFGQTPNLGGNFAGLIAGYALYTTTLLNGAVLISFQDSTGSTQCDVRMNGTGQLFFTQNGTNIPGTSSYAITPNTWVYIEFKALFSMAGGGICEVRINGMSVLLATGITNSHTTATAATVKYFWSFGIGIVTYARDFYALDTVSGANTSYMGDVSVLEFFGNGPGVNSAWAPNVGPFVLTSVNAAGVYQGTITGGAANAYVGYDFNVTGFVNGANNPTGAICTASTATSVTLVSSTGAPLVTVSETHAGSAAFQCIVQVGINQTGTRPNGDVAYIIDSTTNDISDFTHPPLVLSGVILGLIHLSFMRKDNLGSLSAAQVCLSGGVTEQSPAISLGNVYQYWRDIIEVDPNTGTQFSVIGFNAATFGVKKI